MNSELREREADTFLVEGGVDNAVHIEHDIPVVGSLGPYTYLDVNAAGRQRSETDERGRSLQDTFVGCNDAFQYGFDAFVIFSVFHTEYPFGTSGFLLAVISNGVAAQGTVGT